MYYNVLPQIKNAIGARKDKITVPYSRMDFAVLKALTDTGYLKSVEKEAVGKKNVLVARIAYRSKDKDAVVNDFKLISKPSRHFYTDYRSLHPVKQGHGVGVLSTPKGIMTDREARRQRVGGEYLFEIW